MRIAAAVAIAMLGINGVSQTVFAESPTAQYSVDIPAGDLVTALNTLVKQSGADLVYRPEQVQGVATKGVRGNLSVPDAIRLLLQGTKLQLTIAPTGSMLIAVPVRGDVPTAALDARNVELEEVVVTGSNIVSSVDPEKRGAPVEVITAESIDKTGANSLSDVLANNPSMTGGALAEQDQGGRGFVNLRALGAQYTLVLVNGRRLSANDPANALSIPADAIQRVEVLKSGASAVYGSDAVAGVVNVILKSSADGLGANLTYGDTTQGGGATTDLNFYGGFNSENSRFFFLGNRMTRDEIRASQREITSTSDRRRFGGYDERSSIGSPGRIGGVTGLGNVIADPTRVGRGSYSLDPADYRPFNAETDNYDTNGAGNPSVISNPERFTIIGNFEHDLLGGAATFFATGMFFQMRENVWNAPRSISFSAVGPIPASNPYNPFGEELTDVRYRTTELGRAHSEHTAGTNRLSGGVRGEIGSWQLESALTWYRSEVIQRQHGQFITSRLIEAVNRDGPTAFNPFCNACNTDAQFDGLRGTSRYEINFDADIADIRSSGPLFDLPTGTVQAAIGGEYRREQVAVEFDPLTGVGGWAGLGTAGPYDLSRDIYSVFAEVRVPLIKSSGGAASSPLELSLAGRYEDYSDFGTTSTPMATLRFSTWDDQLILRTSYAEAFLAPYLEYATYEFRYSYSDVLLDPETGDPIEALIYDSGTPDIKPETSETVNIGAVFTPHAIPGLTVALDYFRIQQNDLVPGTTSPQGVLDGNESGLVTYGVDIGPAGEDVIVETYFYNAGRRRSSGYELSVNYVLPTLPIGTFTVDVGLARMASFEVEDGSGGLVDISGGTDPAGGPFFSTGALPKTRGLVGIDWTHGALSLSSQYNFMSSYRDLSPSGDPIDRKVPFYATTDFQLSYTLGKDGHEVDWLPARAMKLSLGVENAFDRELPFIIFRNDYNIYENDLRGRYVYARVNVDF
ncbi:TonB-dependent receptor [Steroidobacter sp.]|uniref:TonB-dependent receptor n=1 Tax=Steroidobacter sp. TaxID=1978227 RepID=UPI001A642D9D|nr:TonB-dependent receptor [Steroidobacter sp.]MBL8270216.1 TonB-dependent receptor [Steroidobacter sp.]